MQYTIINPASTSPFLGFETHLNMEQWLVLMMIMQAINVTDVIIPAGTVPKTES